MSSDYVNFVHGIGENCTKEIAKVDASAQKKIKTIK